MAKMRVHELAKELNIKSQEIIDLLKETEYTVKSASSGLEEAAKAIVRGKFGRKEGKDETKTAVSGEPLKGAAKENVSAQPAKGAAKTDTSGAPVKEEGRASAKGEGKAEASGSSESGEASAEASRSAAKGAKADVPKQPGAKDEAKSDVSKQSGARDETKADASKQSGAKDEAKSDVSGQPSAKNEEKTGASKQTASRREAKGDAPKQSGVKGEAKGDASRQSAPKREARADAPKHPNRGDAANSQKQAAKGQTKADKSDASKQSRQESESKQERPKKKSSISAVYNAQYSKQGKRQQGGSKSNGSRGDRGPRRDNNRPEAPHSIIKPRPVGERAMRPISERTANNVDDFSDIKAAATERERERERDRDRDRERDRDRDRNRARNDRRTQSDRPARTGDKARAQNDKSRAQQAGEKNDRQQGRDRNNDRRDRGDRNAQAQGRSGGKNRPDSSRFHKEAAAPQAEEVKGKDSRERSGDRKGASKRQQDRDKLGKRQENYINLEKHGGRKKPQPQAQKPKEEEDAIKTITIPEKLTIRELAETMKVQPSVLVKKLFLKGQMVTVNQEVDYASAEEIALEFNFICEPEEKVDVIAELLKEAEEDPTDMVSRPPVVCVMGHVDHGKTSLLDAIRSTKVTDREAGGITQHIGASVVSINGQNITFLDTPGHEAFTAMRMRGANSTDIAILVVAADDGVMPQTIEAINHAKAAGVEIIVAVNKIDKPSANVERVKQELSEYELIPEDWGGSTVFCPVSAHTKEGLDNLLEMILLTAEVLELKANPNRNARGLVIEAQLDKGRGAVATVLVQKGTLHVGDSIACGSSYGKVRAMIDDNGRRVKTAIPSTPVEILGLNNVPAAGETFVVCDSDKEAKSFAETYISEEKNRLLEETKSRMSLDDLFSQIQSGNMKELNIIVKADVQGSVEAVKQSLVKLSNDEVVVKVIHGGVGAINESDVILASASNAIIIGFNVRPDPIAKVSADNEGVDVRLYKVIYNAIEDVEAAMKGMLDPIFEEKVIGHAEIRQIFKASGVGNIAGSYVLDGILERGCKVRIFRGEEQLFDGNLASLKRFKDDVKEVRTGFECGLVFEGFNDIEEFDRVEAYKMVEVPR